ncbi:MAG TPA: alpha-amylase family glycosyl hydrolase [Burkholderiales bacterium]|nr:alpha-amylase family glycosyl hydrolase [Burkholderiales bacterium]
MSQAAEQVVAPWWRGAVVYQIYPRSFADSDGNGIGDLAGIRQRLDHIQRLGVDAIWLSPAYRSPMVDAGYDVSDHCDIDPLFGTLADMDRLIAETHARGMRILLDYVPNHTSDQHPWFIESRSSRDNPKRDWYIWRDRPNNWVAAFGAGSAWTLDERTGQYYLHLFLPEQPDLNWRHPEVIGAMYGVLNFWLDRGVDGFRIDAVHCIGKDPTFNDDPHCAVGQPLMLHNDQPYSHEVCRGLRKFADAHPSHCVLVGEIFVRSTEAVLRYYGEQDGLHMAFNFSHLDTPWDAVGARDRIREVEGLLGPKGAWPTWVLSNHDFPRHRTSFGGSMRRARAAAVMLLTLRGTIFLYQGEELGLEDAQVGPDEQVDPGGRDGPRAPIPWESIPPHGWSGEKPWLPFPPHPSTHAAETQWQDEHSILHLYRRLLAARKASTALRYGDWEELSSPLEVLAYRRRCGEDERVVCVNFSGRPQQFPLAGRWLIEVVSEGEGEGASYDGNLDAEQALVLKRAGRESGAESRG